MHQPWIGRCPGEKDILSMKGETESSHLSQDGSYGCETSCRLDRNFGYCNARGLTRAFSINRVDFIQDLVIRDSNFSRGCRANIKCIRGRLYILRGGRRSEFPTNKFQIVAVRDGIRFILSVTVLELIRPITEKQTNNRSYRR